MSLCLPEFSCVYIPTCLHQWKICWKSTFSVGFPAFFSFETEISRLNKMTQTQQRNSRTARTGASRCFSPARTCMMWGRQARWGPSTKSPTIMAHVLDQAPAGPCVPDGTPSFHARCRHVVRRLRDTWCTCCVVPIHLTRTWWNDTCDLLGRQQETLEEKRVSDGWLCL